MKKDVLVAVGVGFILGTVVALAATNLPQIIKSVKVPDVKQTPSPTPEITSAAQNPQFSIDSPKDESIIETKTIDVSGQTKGDQIILVETENDQKVIESETDGNFTTKLNLTEGVNTIYFTVYDKEGLATTKSINVYYTTEKL